MLGSHFSIQTARSQGAAAAPIEIQKQTLVSSLISSGQESWFWPNEICFSCIFPCAPKSGGVVVQDKNKA